MPAFIPGYQIQQNFDASQLAILLNQLKAQQAQTDIAGQEAAGTALAAGGPTQGGSMSPPAPAGMPTMPMPNARPMPSALPSGGPMPAIPPMNASLLQPPTGSMPVTPMPQQRNAASIPNPPPGAALPAAPSAGGPAPSGVPTGSSPSGQPAWWKQMAAQIKQQNPNASGKQIMAGLTAMAPLMNQQNKQDFENFKLTLQNQQKTDSLAERERNDTDRNNTARQRADSYDRSINDRNQRSLDNIKIKLDSLKMRSKSAANDPAYRSIETQYKQVSQDLRAAQALGSQATPEQVTDLTEKLAKLSAKLDTYQSPNNDVVGADDASVAGSPAPAAGDRVNVMKDGQTFSLPASQLDDALKQGYQKAQ